MQAGRRDGVVVRASALHSGEVDLAGSIDIPNPKVTNWALARDTDIYYKARIFSFADMLPVELSIFILYSNE